MKYFILDIETNKLVDPDTIWCVVVEDLDNDDVFSFFDSSSFSRWRATCQEAITFIGHNIIEFDAPQLKKLWDIDLGEKSLIDTLILSRLYSPKLEGGHSLEAWGERLNYAKISFNGFDTYSPEMLTYCAQDVSLTKKLYNHLITKLGNVQDAIKIEHDIAIALRKAKQRGFCFDQSKALDLKLDLESRREILDLNLNFPDINTGKWFIPKKNNKKMGYIKDVPIQRYGVDKEIVPFNVNSGQHIINECWKAGWKPTEKTEGYKELKFDDPEYSKKLERYKKYGWKLNETNLSSLPSDCPSALKSFLHRLIIETRIRKLDEWINLVQDDGCVHGDIISLGTWTHRMAHHHPNLANIAAKKSIKYNTEDLKALALDLGGKLRSLWIARPGYVLVGTDAEGIQLRVLAHYMEDDEFTEAVTYGKKEDGTDPHTLNQKRIGRGSRDNSKTFIYAFILGAGDEKVGEIYGLSKREGGELKEGYINSTPGLKRLKSGRIPRDAHQGYTIGFDGRKILCNSKHLMMAAYLQGGEAIVMKLAVCIAIRNLETAGIEHHLINIVHDEMIFECKEEDAEQVRQITEEAIKLAGIRLKLNCPMKGEGKIGRTWLEVH